jgi:outer membrane immunogenic protein
MKRLLLAAFAALPILTGVAVAADMAPAAAYKAPPPPAPAASWTGCNINAGYGYGMYNTDSSLETFPGLVPTAIEGATAGGRGWLGRFGGGCDYQFGVNGLGNFVVGALAEYDFMGIHGNLEPSNTAIIGEAKESGAWYVGGRIGYLVTPNLLSYFDGGYTQTHFDAVNFALVTTGVPADTMSSHDYHGWFLGGGLEYALNFSWLPIHGLFWRNEYRYASYNAADLALFPASGIAPIFATHFASPYVQTATSSLVWRFP